MPNQRELARHLGLSQGTVSLALRGNPLIAPATRKQVEEAARKLGYHPNPMVASLMEHIRSGKKVRDQGCLALLVDFMDEKEWLSFHLAYRQQYEAIRSRAALRGYRTECFFLRAPGLSPAKIDRILHSRGIAGVILAGPRKDSLLPVDMRWERYACVRAGYTWEHRMDCVAADNRQQVELAFQKLREKGFRKTGFCISRRMIPRANSNWLAAHYLCQKKLPATHRIPLFIADHTPAGRLRFQAWLERWKPEAIIGGSNEKTWLDELFPGKKRAPVFCSRFCYPDLSGPAIEENNSVIGETLCDLVIEKIMHQKRGLPEHPLLTLIEGSWRG